MRVLFLKDALVMGGAERQLALMMKYLPDGCERRVWTMGGGPFAKVIAEQGQRVDVNPRAARLDVRPAADLWHLLWDWRPDIVHSWDWMSSAAALPLCRILGIPLIDGTIRTGSVEPHRANIRRLCMALSVRVVANSLAGLLAWDVSPSKGRVLYNGFDPERLALCGAKPARPPKPTVVAMAGRMTAQKDFSTVIRAARELSAQRAEDWQFVLLGSGPEKQRLVADARDLLQRGVVKIAAPGLEVLPQIRDADIGVLMTNERVAREGCSNAIMEYTACGLPVICTKGGGNPEFVLEGQTGYLLEGGDCEGLVERLRRFADHPELARRMGAMGRERLLDRFSTDRMVTDLLGLYRDVLTH